MLLGSRLTLIFTVLVIVILTKTARGGQTCLPRCLPTEQTTKMDCLVFRYIPTCRHSRFQPFVRESDCACQWKSFLRVIAPIQKFQKDGLGCLTWALKSCAPGSNADGGEIKASTDRQQLLISELLRIAKGLKAEVPVKDWKEIPKLLQELDKDVRSLDNAEGSDVKDFTVQEGQQTGEFYGQLNKETGTLHTAERLADQKDKNDLKDTRDMIGPGFEKKRWWLWNIKDAKFDLAVFFLVLLFVVIFMLVALYCLSDRVGKKKTKKEKREKGDLDLDLYKILPGRARFPSTSDSFTRMDRKRTSFEQFIDKWRNYRGKKGNVFEEFHNKMRRMSTMPDYRPRPRQPTPVQTYKRKMVRVGAQTPVYEQINEPNVSEDEDVIYHRARSPVYSINTTYEQPIPVYQNRPRPRDQTYYNVKPKDSSDNKNITKHVDRSSLSPVPQVIETYEELSRQNTPKDDIYYNESLSTSRNYPEPSPVSHRSQGSHRPSPPFSLQVELPGVDEAQRVHLPRKGKKKGKTQKPKFVILPVSKVAR